MINWRRWRCLNLLSWSNRRKNPIHWWKPGWLSNENWQNYEKEENLVLRSIDHVHSVVCTLLPWKSNVTSGNFDASLVFDRLFHNQWGKIRYWKGINWPWSHTIRMIRIIQVVFYYVGQRSVRESQFVTSVHNVQYIKFHWINRFEDIRSVTTLSAETTRFSPKEFHPWTNVKLIQSIWCQLAKNHKPLWK